MSIIPYLLNNSEVWTELDSGCLEELERLQTLFLSVLLAVPITCARPSLAWDTGSLSMKNRIIERKLNFVVHLKKLGGESLAKQVYDEQVSHGWPGLVSEAQEFCREIRLADVTKDRSVDDSKWSWKHRIKEAAKQRNELDLKEEINIFEKLETLKGEEYGQKSYLKTMSMSEARTLFRIRTRMIRCKMNQSSDPYNKSSLWKCEDCGYVDTQRHILHCPAYQSLREGKYLDSDADIVSYFSAVLKLREGGQT